MLVLSREEMQKADQEMIELGVPGLVLMEHAAIQLKKHVKPGALILCGSGNNGGDGLALARLMELKGENPRVLIQSKRELVGDPLTNLKAAKNLGVKIDFFYDDLSLLKEALSKASMVVDCLFGTGLTREIKSPYYESIRLLNESGLYILSTDLPSGLDANTGETLGIAVKADKTISFHALKKGMLGYPNVEVVDIEIKGFED